MNITIYHQQTPQGTIYIGSDGHEYEMVSGGVNGLGFLNLSHINVGNLAEGINAQKKKGFFGQLVQTASGLFKKKDGTNTFIGDTAQKFAQSFGDRLANNISPGMNTNQSLVSNPFMANPGGSNLQEHDPNGDNPLKEDNTMLYVAGAAGVIGLGIGIWALTKKAS